MGVIGISYIDYMSMTFRTINAIINAHQQRRKDEYRNGWEQTRMLAFYAANPETAKKAGSPKGLIKFPWETAETPKLSREEIRGTFEGLDKKIKELHG